MSYQITTTSGNILTTVPDTQIVSTYAGLSLLGKFYPGFGTALNNNLVHITENFASNTPPTNPLVGQIWYDTISNNINYWNGSEFKSISIVTSNDAAPLNPEEGDQWFDTTTQQLYIWNGYEWVLIGPANSGGENEGFVVETFSLGSSNIYYLNLYANNELLGIVSSVEFNNSDITGFGNIRPGLNFVTNPESVPSIIAGGIYNVSDITVGDSDQLGIETDSWDNGIITVNNGNILIATNGNAESNVAAFSEWSNGNIEGIVYFDTIYAKNFGNLPATIIPGANNQIIFNNGTSLQGATNFQYYQSNLTSYVTNFNTSNIVAFDSKVTDSFVVTGLSSLQNTAITTLIVGESLISSGNITAEASLSVETSITDFGTLFLGGELTAGEFSLFNWGAEIGNQNGTATNPYIDFHSSGGSQDYDSRIIASGGTSGVVGEGTLTIAAATTQFSGNISAGQITASAAISSTQTVTAEEGFQASATSESILGQLSVNGQLTSTGGAQFSDGIIINTGTNSYSLPTSRGTVGYVLSSNGDGSTSWIESASTSVTQNAGLASIRSLYPVASPESTPPIGSYVYHNTSSSPMLVTVSADLGGGGFRGVVYCDSSSSPITDVAQFSRVNAGSSAPNYYPGSVTFLVPPGFYYGISVTSGSGTPTIRTWTEWIF